MIKRALVVLGIFILGIGLLANQLQLAAIIVIPILLGILVYGLLSSCGDRIPRFSEDERKRET
jgi:hypothetical protein